MFQLAKHGTVVGLLHFSPYFLFACATSNRTNLAFKTTIIEDAHLTLIGILSKVEANNSLFFFVITNIREKICRVSVPVHIYNSLLFPAADLELRPHYYNMLTAVDSWCNDLVAMCSFAINFICEHMQLRIFATSVSWWHKLIHIKAKKRVEGKQLHGY